MQSVILEWVQEQGKDVSGQSNAIQMRRAGMAEVTVTQHHRFLSCDQRTRAPTELMPRRAWVRRVRKPCAAPLQLLRVSKITPK